MRIITLNANGIRAADRKGLFQWLPRQQADVVCIQETKARIEQLKAAQFFPDGHHCYYHDALRPGYSGVAVYSRHQPDRVHYGLGREEFDCEGRWLQVDFGALSIVSLYLPSGSHSEERQAFKFQIMDWFLPMLVERRQAGREYVICGDWNIAHKAIDLKNWKSNRKNSGFLPEERAWMDRLFGEAGFVDAFRVADPGEDRYTWWSNRGRAWEKNVGWRIDYQVVTPVLGERVEAASIFTDARFSDHAPLIIDYDGDIR